MKLVLLILTVLSVFQATAAADSQPLWWEIEDADGNKIGTGKKCPYDNTRLFKSVQPVGSAEDVESCYLKCKSIQNCKHISYGFYDGKWMCMGCNGHQYGYDNHDVFTVYEIKQRDDWPFTKVRVKSDCDSPTQRYGDAITGITQDECHTRCKNQQGCGYFSMSDMAFSPTGSGTCNLCKFSDGFSSDTNSNTYSVLSPADYKPICAGPTGVVWGDPHLITYDKLRFDCQGRGEYVLAKSTGADPLAIHGVFEDTGGSRTGPSVTRSVAMKVDEAVPIFRVNIPDMPVDGKCSFSYNIGDNEDIIEPADVVQYFVDKYPGIANVYTNEKAVIVTFPKYQTRIEILTHSGHFAKFGCRMRANVCITPENHDGKIVGLFGSPNNSKNDDWMENDGNGTPLTVPVNDRSKLRKDGTEYCRREWCVPRSHSLYSDATYTEHNKCADDSFDPEAYEQMINALPADIVAACEAKSANPGECTADIAVLKNFTETDGETLPADLTAIVDQFAEEEEDSKKVSETTEAELYAEDDWKSPDVTTLSTAAAKLKAASDAGSRGDPHFKTWRNEHFEYHSQCDLVLASHPNFADGLGLDIQIRTKLVRFWSYIKSAAIRIGEDIIEVQGTEGPVNSLQFWFNFHHRSENVKTIGGFPITMYKGTGRFNRNKFVIDLGSKYPGQKIIISTWREFVSVNFEKPTFEAFGESVGMLGEFNTGNTLSRDGRIIHDFKEFGDDWQVRPSDHMLFHDVAMPQFPKKCIMPEDPQGARRRRLDESSISAEAAEKACAALTDPLDQKDCVYDILATQDLNMAGAY